MHNRVSSGFMGLAVCLLAGGAASAHHGGDVEWAEAAVVPEGGRRRACRFCR